VLLNQFCWDFTIIFNSKYSNRIYFRLNHCLLKHLMAYLIENVCLECVKKFSGWLTINVRKIFFTSGMLQILVTFFILLYLKKKKIGG